MDRRVEYRGSRRFHDKEQQNARAEKYATDLSVEDYCTFKKARCQDSRRMPLVLEIKGIACAIKAGCRKFCTANRLI